MNRTKISTFLATIASFTLLAACTSGGAPEDIADGGSWQPDGDVSFVVPANAGGGQDLMARTIADGFQKGDDDLTIAVENRPGGSSAVGYAHVQQMEGDPEALITATVSLLSLPLTTDVSYTWDSFTPVAMIGEDQAMAVVRSDSDFQSLSDAVTAASSGMVSVGVAGQDGPDAVTLQLLTDETGGNFQPVVFQSGAESVTALLAGDIDIAILNPGEVVGQLDSGDARAVAVFSDERYPEDSDLADVPTAIEQGIDVSFGQLRGIVAAPGITEAQQQYWIEQVEEYSTSPEYEQYLEDNMMIGKVLSGDEFAEYMSGQAAQLEQVLGQQ